MLLTSENSMQGENYEHSRTGACPYTSSAWRSFGLARRMAARGAVSQRSGVIRDSLAVQEELLRTSFQRQILEYLTISEGRLMGIVPESIQFEPCPEDPSMICIICQKRNQDGDDEFNL